MGGDSEGSRKDGSNGAGPGSNAEVVGTIGVTLWKLELGGDRVDDQVPHSVPPSFGATDHGDYGKTWGWQRVGVPSIRGGDGLRGAQPHWSIHQEAVDEHIGYGGLPAGLCTVHGGGEDASDNT